jgi:hypothetical protein
MISFKSPKNIPGLALWLDASDVDTINNGRVSNGSFVNTWVDKAGGYVLTSPQSGGSFIAGAGPTYSVNSINGKNSILFSYFNSAVADNTSYRRLSVANCTPLGVAENTTYIVFFPLDARQQTAASSGTVAQRECVVTVHAGSRVTSAPGSTFPDKLWFVNTYNNTTGAGTGRNTMTGYIDAVSPYTSTTFPDPTGLRSYLYDAVLESDGANKVNLTSGQYYGYGKVNIFGTRYKDGMKKFTILRREFYHSENFRPKYGRYTNLAITVASPVLTIGAGWPGYGTGGSINTVRDLGNGQPFEGYFCEMLVFTRVLTNGEANAVESYLKKKWIG